MVVKKRISGHDLPQNVGSEVILLGRVNKVGSSSRSLELITTDNVTVNVSLPDILDENLDGFVEIHGKPQSKSTLSCTSYVHFPPEMTNDFDSKEYNELMTVLNVLGDNKWKMSARGQLL